MGSREEVVNVVVKQGKTKEGPRPRSGKRNEANEGLNTKLDNDFHQTQHFFNSSLRKHVRETERERVRKWEKRRKP